MATYLHPGFTKSSRDRKAGGTGPDKPHTGGLFLDDTQAVNPFINVPRLPVFKIMSGGESAAVGTRNLAIQDAAPQGTVNETANSNTGHMEYLRPTPSRTHYQGAVYNQSAFNATALSPSPRPGSAKTLQQGHSPDHLQVHLQNQPRYDFPSHHQQLCNPNAPTRMTSNNNTYLYESERVLHIKQERERVREIERDQEREREERKHSWTAATSLHSQYRTEEAPLRLSPLHGGMHSGSARQDRAGAVRPFSCFGANGLYNDVSHSGSSTTPRVIESICDFYSPSPHSVSANLSPAPSPVWSGVRAQHACGDRPVRRRERDLSEMCERQQVQQFNEMVQVRHTQGGVTPNSTSIFRAREGATRANIPPPLQLRSTPSLSPRSLYNSDRDHDQMEVSYMDDETYRMPSQFQRQHQSDVNSGLVSRSSSYRSRDDNSEATLVLTRRMLRCLS